MLNYVSIHVIFHLQNSDHSQPLTDYVLLFYLLYPIADGQRLMQFDTVRVQQINTLVQTGSSVRPLVSFVLFLYTTLLFNLIIIHLGFVFNAQIRIGQHCAWQEQIELYIARYIGEIERLDNVHWLQISFSQKFQALFVGPK